MKYKKIVELIREVEKSGMEKFELKDGEFAVSMSKANCHGRDVHTMDRKTENVPPAVQQGTIVRSPLVGTFHASLKQDEEALVTIGAKIEAGQTLGTIEAMKLMNDIVAGCAGTVSEILVKDGEMVEYGQALFVIEE